MMTNKRIYVENYEFQFTLSATQNGGWTVSILHIDRSQPHPEELLSVIDIEFESETEALRYAEIVATRMARRRNACAAEPLSAEGRLRRTS